MAKMEDQWKDVKNLPKGNWTELKTGENMAVVPIVGKAVNALFGTVTERDFQVIRWKLRWYRERSKNSNQGGKRKCIDTECDKVRSGKE